MTKAIKLLLWMALILGGLAHAGTVTYVYTDPQGTPLAEADASGNITATYDYAPYGSQAMGAAPNGPGYTGHVNDPESGLVYMQARYYDPAVGRFISTDPVGPSAGNAFNFNRFAYAGNNPVINIDPNGEECTGSLITNSSGNCASTGTTVAGPGSGGVTLSKPAQSGFKQGLIGVAKSILNALPHDAGQKDFTPSNDSQSTGMIVGTAVVGIAEAVPTDGESAEASAHDFVDLASPGRRTHIIEGDATGGGHRYGLGISGKSEFPSGWSDDKIMHEISDIATDPNATRSAGRGGRTIVEGTRDGVNIHVILGRHGEIVTGYPANTRRNP